MTVTQSFSLSSKANLYLYFIPELILSATILFVESEIITAYYIIIAAVIIIVNLLRILMLTSEQCFTSWVSEYFIFLKWFSHGLMGTALGCFWSFDLTRFTLCFIWVLVGSSSAVNFFLVCYTLCHGSPCITWGMTGTLEKREPELPSCISNALFYFPLFPNFSFCIPPTCILPGVFDALRIVASLTQ